VPLCHGSALGVGNLTANTSQCEILFSVFDFLFLPPWKWPHSPAEAPQTGLSSKATLHSAVTARFLAAASAKPTGPGTDRSAGRAEQGRISPPNPGRMKHTELAELVVSSARGSRCDAAAEAHGMSLVTRSPPAHSLPHEERPERGWRTAADHLRSPFKRPAWRNFSPLFGENPGFGDSFTANASSDETFKFSHGRSLNKTLTF